MFTNGYIFVSIDQMFYFFYQMFYYIFDFAKFHYCLLLTWLLSPLSLVYHFVGLPHLSISCPYLLLTVPIFIHLDLVFLFLHLGYLLCFLPTSCARLSLSSLASIPASLMVLCRLLSLLDSINCNFILSFNNLVSPLRTLNLHIQSLIYRAKLKSRVLFF